MPSASPSWRCSRPTSAMCAEDPRGGRGAQHTILDVPAVLERPGFRRQVLKKIQRPGHPPVVRRLFRAARTPLPDGDHQPRPDQGPQVPGQPRRPPDRRPAAFDDRFPRARRDRKTGHRQPERVRRRRGHRGADRRHAGEPGRPRDRRPGAPAAGGAQAGHAGRSTSSTASRAPTTSRCSASSPSTAPT